MENFNNNDIFIPTEITRHCVISSHLFLITGLLYISKNHIVFGILLILLYVTSAIHWNCLYVKSIIRSIDRVVVAIVVIYAFIFIFEYDIQFIGICLFCAIVFYFNELVYFYEIELPKTGDYRHACLPEFGRRVTTYPLLWNYSEYNDILNMSCLTYCIIRVCNIKPIFLGDGNNNEDKQQTNSYNKNVLIHALFVHTVFALYLIGRWFYL
jgi:hypothetical protein